MPISPDYFNFSYCIRPIGISYFDFFFLLHRSQFEILLDHFLISLDLYYSSFAAMATATDKTTRPQSSIMPADAADSQTQSPGLLTTKAESSQTSRPAGFPNLGRHNPPRTRFKNRKISDRKIYVTTSGIQERISEILYQIFLKQNMKRITSSSLSTDLASQIEEDDSEPIE